MFLPFAGRTQAALEKMSPMGSIAIRRRAADVRQAPYNILTASINKWMWKNAVQFVYNVFITYEKSRKGKTQTGYIYGIDSGYPGRLYFPDRLRIPGPGIFHDRIQTDNE